MEQSSRRSSCEESGGGCGKTLLAANGQIAAEVDRFACEIREEDFDYDDGNSDWDDTTLNTYSQSCVLEQRFEALVSLEQLRSRGLSHAGMNAMSAGERKAEQARHTGLSRDERATTEHVLDPRTRLLRAAIYVCMTPREWITPEEVRRRQQAYCAGSTSSHWPFGIA